MPDPNFHSRADSLTIGDIAALTGAEISDSSAAGKLMENVAALSEAAANDISFLDNIKYKEDLKTTKAGACFVNEDMAALAPEGVCLLITPSPYKAYALTAQKFYPEMRPDSVISDAAHIDGNAQIDEEGTVIEAGAVIKAGAQIGKGCWVGANAVIGENVKLGMATRIGDNAVISHSIIGNHVRIYPGCCIGQDGFGFAIDPAGFVKVPQLGRVIIQDGVEIGANTTIDRGAGPDTVIGAGTWIDNLVQIGHNVKIGRGCVLVSQCGVSGSTELEDFVVVAGQAGIAGHLKIGTGTRIAAKSGIMRDIEAGQDVMGYPAVPMKQFMRQVAALNRLIQKKK